MEIKVGFGIDLHKSYGDWGNKERCIKMLFIVNNKKYKFKLPVFHIYKGHNQMVFLLHFVLQQHAMDLIIPKIKKKNTFEHLLDI